MLRQQQVAKLRLPKEILAHHIYEYLDAKK
jgi:hypothetical protein